MSILNTPKGFRLSLTLAYLILIIALVVGARISWGQTQELERQSLLRDQAHCQTQNELKEVIQVLLDELTLPQEVDTEARAEERERIQRRLQPAIEPEECPPPPP